MDFGALPPEINSAKLYSGPGAGSMLVAAAAWEGIADELYYAAGSCHGIISALTDEAWLGEASVAMVGAAAPYLTWMSATAAQAQQTAAQARAAAGAFETAFAAMVPPAVIAANRALVMLLTATNVLGVNTPAIATAEAHYGEMWAQDAAAMYGYAGASAAASTLAAFPPPAEVADSTVLPQAASAIPQALQQFAQPISTLSSLASPASSAASTMSSSMSAMSSVSSVAKVLGSSTTAVSSEVATLGSAPTGLLAGLAGPQSAVSAEVGRGVSLGPLSVPQSWTSTALTSRPVATPLPGAGGVAAVHPTGSGNMLGGLPIAGMVPRGGEGGLSTAASRAGVRPTVMPRPEFGG